MVYSLMIQKDGEADVETVKLTSREQLVLQQYIAEHCCGYSISDKEYKRLLRGQNILATVPEKSYEIALV